MQTILAIDDELSIRESYRVILAKEYRLLLAENAKKGLEILEESHVDVILLDMLMPGMTGLEFLKQIKENGETVPVIVVTASNCVTTAVEAMKHGAREYMIKPFDIEEIKMLIARILSDQRDKLELEALREERTEGFESLIGDSPAMLEIFDLAHRAMQIDSTVLVTGETGTGKELMARAIHSGGERGNKAFVPLCCSAIPDQLVESELFGHAKGAFTGAHEKRIGKVQVADQGTLFLDEIGEMPLDAQSKLLRVLQERSFYPVGSSKNIEVDIRIICATNRNLEDSIQEGIFREDLYYRINVLQIEMPPLRKRRTDIPKLVAHFVAKHKSRVNAKITDFAPDAMGILTSYHWPGNVRELENTTERILVHKGSEEVIRSQHLEGILPNTKKQECSSLIEFDGLPLEEATQQLERYLIARALTRADNVQSRAAEMLGSTRRILKYKMDQLEMAVDQ